MAQQPHNRGPIGKDADHCTPPLQLLVQPLQRIRADHRGNELPEALPGGERLLQRRAQQGALRLHQGRVAAERLGAGDIRQRPLLIPGGLFE